MRIGIASLVSVMAAGLLAQAATTLTIEEGWNLVGMSEGVATAEIPSSCYSSIYMYSNSAYDSGWSLYGADRDIIIASTQGFWIRGIDGGCSVEPGEYDDASGTMIFGLGSGWTMRGISSPFHTSTIPGECYSTLWAYDTEAKSWLTYNASKSGTIAATQGFWINGSSDDSSCLSTIVSNEPDADSTYISDSAVDSIPDSLSHLRVDEWAVINYNAVACMVDDPTDSSYAAVMIDEVVGCSTFGQEVDVRADIDSQLAQTTTYISALDESDGYCIELNNIDYESDKTCVISKLKEGASSSQSSSSSGASSEDWSEWDTVGKMTVVYTNIPSGYCNADSMGEIETATSTSDNVTCSSFGVGTDYSGELDSVNDNQSIDLPASADYSDGVCLELTYTGSDGSGENCVGQLSLY